MKRKTYVNKVRALADAIQYKYNGIHADGHILRFYTNFNITPVLETHKSYKVAWESLKPARDLVGM